MQLTELLRRNTSVKPDALCTIFVDRRSFAKMQDRVARLAAGLASPWATHGDRIGMLSLNSDRYYAFYQAVPWAGCAVNPVNIRRAPAEIACSPDDCDTRILIVDDTFAPLVDDLRARSLTLKHVIHAGDGPAPAGMISYEALVADNAPMTDAGRSGDDLAGVFYTGGTAGFPKGVMLSQRGLYVNGLTMVAEGGMDEDSHGLIATPMFHIAAELMMNGFSCVGARQIVRPRCGAADHRGRRGHIDAAGVRPRQDPEEQGPRPLLGGSDPQHRLECSHRRHIHDPLTDVQGQTGRPEPPSDATYLHHPLGCRHAGHRGGGQ